MINQTSQIFKVRKYFFQSFNKKKIHHVPNEVLFRTLSQFKFNFKRAECLDLGFSSGANLIEIYKRGGKVYGVDLLKKNVSKMKKLFGSKNFFLLDLNSNYTFPKLKKKLDLIIAKDVIYYLTEQAMEKLFKEVCFKLKNFFFFLNY